MPRLDISQLGDDSRIWIFGISPSLDATRRAAVLTAVDSFLASWAAHGEPINSARDILLDSFLVIGVDRQSETSGCSIDRMFGLLQRLERELGVSILEADRVFQRAGDGSVQAIRRLQFRESGEPKTVVFDTLAERLGEVRSGRWEKRAADSWHRDLLTKTANSRTLS